MKGLVTKDVALSMGLSGEMVRLSSVKPNPDNPRVMRDEKFTKLCNSIREFPKMLALRPMVTDADGVVLGGNMRLRALQEVGYKEVPAEWVKRADTLTDEEQRRFIIADNVEFGEWDYDALANEWTDVPLNDWGMDVWEDDDDNSGDEYERKKKEFEERMQAGDIDEDDPEYQEFLDKFRPKKTTDDCYTPPKVYEAVADWVANEYGVKKDDFVRPFYPGGDYTKETYKPTDIVVDNPPFSILAEILRFYHEKGVRFFLFAPTLTLFSSSSSSSSSCLCTGVTVTYDNGANVSTSFVTNLGDRSVRFRSCPTLYAAVKNANDEVLKELHKNLPKYVYDRHVVVSSWVSQLSRLWIDFSVPVESSVNIDRLDAQKETGQAIYGKGYLVSERMYAEREKAEREKATMWHLSEREREIVRRLK